MSETRHPIQGPGPGNVVGQFFGIFHGCEKEVFDTIVRTAPFDQCNLLILAFVGVYHPEGFTDPLWMPKFHDGRDNNFNGGQAKGDDTDDYRVRLVVSTARAKNPNIKILVSLGFPNNDVVLASQSPKFFAEGLREIVQIYGFDGFDIDYESVDDQNGAFKADDLIRLMQTIRQELDTIIPKREMIMTITPADYTALNKEALEQFTYTMPQSYGHGGNEMGGVDWYQQQVGSFDRIVYGLSGEGFINGDPSPDDPQDYVPDVKKNGAAGVFSWRLDTDTMSGDLSHSAEGVPTFATAIKMWKLMNNLPA